MTTKAEIIASLKAQYPTLKVGTDENGYTDLDSAEYETTISDWADIQLANEKEVADQLAAEQEVLAAKASRDAKLAKMGFTAAEIENW